MIIPVSISEQLKTDYLNYSVQTVNRSIPSVVDGLKAVQRRIIQSAIEQKLHSDGPFRKVSRLDGYVVGNYSPHGSAADAIISLGDMSSYLNPLMNLHGNIGGISTTSRQKISSDPSASARYLECKLTSFSEQVFDMPMSLQKTKPNYDGSQKEVVEYVPALPIALLNQQIGIGTGYATKSIGFPAKNVVNAISNIANPRKAIAALGIPDIPWNTNIIKDEAALELHQEGKASIKLIGEWHFGTHKRRKTIVVTKLASGNVEQFIDKIKAGLINEKITGIASIVDETSYDIRVVIILKSKVSPEELLPQLLAYTTLSDSYSAKLTFVERGLPREFTPYEALKTWYEYRRQVVFNATLVEYAATESKLEKLNGLISAFPLLKKIVYEVLESDSPEQAKVNIINKFNLTETIAETILEIPVKRLTKLNQTDLIKQAETLTETSNKLKSVLSSEKKLHSLILSKAKAAAKVCCDRVSQVVSAPEVKAVPKLDNKQAPRARKLTPQQIIFNRAKEVVLNRHGLNTKFPGFVGLKRSSEVDLNRHIMLWGYVKHTKGIDKRKLDKMTDKEIKTILKENGLIN